MNDTKIENLISKLETQLPELDTKNFDELVKELFLSGEKKDEANILLSLVSLLVDNDYIIIVDDLAKSCVKYKVERKLFLLNLILDVLKYINAIEYKLVNESKIIAKIVDEDIKNSLVEIREVMIKYYNENEKEILEGIEKYKSSDEYKQAKEFVNG